MLVRFSAAGACRQSALAPVVAPYPRTMLRNAAFASSVVESIPTVLLRTTPASASCCYTQVKTAWCASRLSSRRVREIVDCSGGDAGGARRRNDRRLGEWATRQATLSPWG